MKKIYKMYVPVVGGWLWEQWDPDQHEFKPTKFDFCIDPFKALFPNIEFKPCGNYKLTVSNTPIGKDCRYVKLTDDPSDPFSCVSVKCKQLPKDYSLMSDTSMKVKDDGWLKYKGVFVKVEKE